MVMKSGADLRQRPNIERQVFRTVKVREKDNGNQDKQENKRD